jgi:hypothetical protein
MASSFVRECERTLPSVIRGATLAVSVLIAVEHRSATPESCINALLAEENNVF